MKLRSLLVIASILLAAGAPLHARAATPPEGCSVLTDATGDANGYDETDIVSLSMGSNSDTLMIALDLAAAPTGIAEQDGGTYDVSWGDRDPSQPATFDVQANIDSGSTTFSATLPDFSTAPVDGRVDGSVVTMYVKLADLGLADGAVLPDVRVVTAAHLASGVVGTGGDAAPDDPSVAGPAFTLGDPACPLTVPNCPVVNDAWGDEYDTLSTAHWLYSQRALDLLAVGASSDATSLTLSAKVADLSAGYPVGRNAIGWVMSWYAGDGQRMALEAIRTPSGDMFQYASVPNDVGMLSDEFFGGTTTTGTIDIDTNTISVVVPRAAIGDPADGTVLPDLGAESFSYASGAMVVPYLAADQAGTADYTLGTDCGADS